MGDGTDIPIEVGQEDVRSGERRRRHRSKRKRRTRKQERLFRNIVWLGGGLAVGLPVLAALLYAMSR